jgi:hypothetical protein
MPAYVRLQAQEFAREQDGYTATKHQRESGTGYFDAVLMAITGGDAATTALTGSTESEQFRAVVSRVVDDNGSKGRGSSVEGRTSRVEG